MESMTTGAWLGRVAGRILNGSNTRGTQKHEISWLRTHHLPVGRMEVAGVLLPPSSETPLAKVVIAQRYVLQFKMTISWPTQDYT